MKRLLIANRGEIALRIAHTANELALSTVGVFVPEDDALSRGYGTNERVPLEGHGAGAYLDIEQLVRIAREHRCDALHPGYGFVSESADLARACHEAGIVFVGPSPETLQRFGDKAAARGLAAELGIPIVPGIPAPASLADLEGFFDAQSPGDALILKAVAGGGGRGMRVVRQREDLGEALLRCQSEAERSFGSAGVFAERFVEGARHVEIQILGDRDGAVGHAWERECSLQRRHQKLIEIAPAPGIDPDVRSALIDAALRLARAVDYQGLGTVEFLVEPNGRFAFIEVNPRLQVEHTVTEAITGLDLVAVQLALAAGKSLASLSLEQPPPLRGHAMQLRVLAEATDSFGRLRPSADVVKELVLPSGPGIRVDTALRRGIAPHPAFDSLVAKLIVSHPAPDFARCVARARGALAALRIEGPSTNIALLTALLERPEIARADVSTGFFDQHAPALLAAAAAATEASSAARSSNSAVPSEAIHGSPANRHATSNPQLAEGIRAITAPLIGTVLEVCVEEGQAVSAEQAICILESMKMEHVVQSPSAGVVTGLFVEVGGIVSEGATLAGLRASDKVEDQTIEVAAVDLDVVRPDLEEVRARHALLEDSSRPEAVARRRSRGQRTARENLAQLCDPGSFTEYGALAVAAMRRVRPVEELQRKTPGDAIITGFGTVNADRVGPENARCALLVVDATVLAGTQGFFHHQKIDRLLELAEQAGTPVVFFPEGGGGRPNDTDASDVFVAGLNVTSFHAFARLSGRVPRVSIVSGFCFAGSAAFAGCADVIIATRNTSLGMGGPAMIEGGGLGVYAPEDVGPASVLEPGGVIDVLVEDEVEAVETARTYLSYFQGALEGAACSDQRALRHLIPENRRRVYDIRRVIDTLCDTDSVLELRRAHGVGMITALVRIDGRPMGLVANDPMHLGGAIDDTGAEKAARFLQLCDAFGLPVLSLCDTPGFMVGPEIEARGQVRKVSRLFVVGASLSVPIFCVILRKAYGLGAQAMAGGSFKVPFDIVAWPTGEIGGMGLEGAVRLGFKKELDALEDEAEKSALFEKLVGVMYKKGKALHAASQLEFDAVIDPAETRARIIRGLRTAGPIEKGSRGFIDTW